MAEETAEQRMRRARRCVMSTIEHSKGKSPKAWWSAETGWSISYAGGMDYTPGSFEPIPEELFTEVIMVLDELGRAYPKGKLAEQMARGAA